MYWRGITMSTPDWGDRGFVVQAVTEYGDPLDWWPIENIVSTRPGWFYHAAEDGKLKSLEKLLDIDYKSIGYGGAAATEHTSRPARPAAARL